MAAKATLATADYTAVWNNQQGAARVLLISTDFREAGGGHHCLQRHMRRLRASGFRTGLLTQELHRSRTTHQFFSPTDFDFVHEIPFARWFWPPIIYRLNWTARLRRLMISLEGLLTLVRHRPDAVLIAFNGSPFSLWASAARMLGVPLGIIVYDLRELWADSPSFDLSQMRADTVRTFQKASILWFVSEELRHEYARRVPSLNPEICHILPPIPGAIKVTHVGWRDEFAKCTTLTFAGGIKSDHHDVFCALMQSMGASSGRLTVITQQKRIASLEREFTAYKDVLELRPIPPVASDGIKWAGANSTCLLVYYSFVPGAEELAMTSFPSKLLEYAHLGLPILIASPPETTIAKWARRTNWPLFLDSLEPDRILEVLERLKQRAFWEHCALISREMAADEFCPVNIHQRFEEELRAMIECQHSAPS